MAGDVQRVVNDGVWRGGELLGSYANRQLRPVEVMMLIRHRDALAGRVLELGCGAGRLTGYLIDVAEHVQGVDLSPAMVEHCRRTYPSGTFSVGDIRELASELGQFDVVVAAYAVLDVLSDAERRRTLGAMARMLRPNGLLLMSTHNRARAAHIPSPMRLRAVSRLGRILELRSVPRRLRNHRRLRPQEYLAADYAILNDEPHDYSLLHYYISREAQERQLQEEGFQLVECLDIDGHPVVAGEEAASEAGELHYVARLSGVDGS